MAVATTTLAYAALGWAAVGTGISAATQIAAGKSQAKQYQYEGAYNAEVYRQQAELAEQQKKVEEFQANRSIARARGTLTARAGGSGLLLSGSPLAIMIDNESLMQYDKAIGQYNLEVKKRYAQSGARFSEYMGEQKAKASIFSGYSNAFQSILSFSTNLAMMSLPIKGMKA